MKNDNDYIKRINNKPLEWKQAFIEMGKASESATQEQIMQVVGVLKNLIKNKAD